MGKTFVCSLCRNGIIGGGLYIDEQSITYSTQKLTVSPLYRNLVLPMNGNDNSMDVRWLFLVHQFP